MTRAFDAALGQPWAIYPAALHTILEIAQRGRVDAAALSDWKDKMAPGAAFHPRAGEALTADRFDGSYVVNGVAVIPVDGPIFPKANMMTDMSGATALSRASVALDRALANPAVRAIVLDVNSPGGVAMGVHEFAQSVRAASGRKRLAAYVGGLGASAAYWIAAAAPTIVVDAAALLGSIGVVSAQSVQEAPDQNGERRVEIVSTNAPNKRPDAGTAEGQAEIRRTLDALEAVFHADVAAFRGVSVADVIDRFGAGGVRVGADAVAAGMADRVGDFATLLAELSATPTGAVRGAIPQAVTATVIAKENQIMNTHTGPIAAALAASSQPALTAEAFAAEYPALAEGFRAEGAAAERARIAGIDAHALPGHEKLIADLKADGRTTPDQAAAAILAAEKQQRGATLAAMAAAGASPAAAAPVPLAPSAVAPMADAETLPIEERAKAAWDADASVRAEFLSYEGYLAFRRADDAGLVKMLAKKAA